MSETELSVICKNCGSEVSPYVTECPYCGTRLRKRAPKLERRGDALEAQRPRRRRRPRLRRSRGTGTARPFRPYATLTAILASAILLLVQKASGDPLATFGGPIGLAIFATAVERRLGNIPTAVLLLACGALGMVAASAVADAQGDFAVVAGGNGMALGAVAAWFAIRRAEADGAIDEEYDTIGVAVAAAVLIALPLFVPTADFVAGLVGGAVGALAGLAAAVVHPSE